MRKDVVLPTILPSIQNNLDLYEFLEKYDDKWVLLKIGDINTLPSIIRKLHANGTKVIVHQDSIRGISADRSGVQFLANIGADGIDTTKQRCISMIHETGALAVVQLFVIDSISVNTAIHVIQEGMPDYAILMPSCIPSKVVKSIRERSKCSLLGGGMCSDRKDLDQILSNGMSGAVTSEKSLWHRK